MMPGTVVLWVLTAAMIWPSPMRASVYEWSDEEGVTHFSDTPPEGREPIVHDFPAPCRLKRQVRGKQTLEVVIALGAYLGGLDESNRALAAQRLREKYRSLEVPLHDLEEYCKGGDQGACSCLRAISSDDGARGFAPAER